VNAKGIVLPCAASGSMIGGAGVQTRTSSAAAEKPVITQVIRDTISWALTKDRALQESTMARDAGLFYHWITSDLTVRGWDQHVKLFDTWMDPRFKATLTEIRDLQINLSRSGDVAWWSATLDDLGEWDGKPVGARNIRWTGVLEKRDGKWVIVQMHGSLPADKLLEQPDQPKKEAR